MLPLPCIITVNYVGISHVKRVDETRHFKTEPDRMKMPNTFETRYLILDMEEQTS